MPAPYRVEQPEGGPIQGYFARVMKMIPVDVVSLYLGIAGFIPEKEKVGQLVWALVCLGCVVPSRILGTRDPARGKGIDWVVVILSSVAFMIWVYTIGGPFKSFHIYNAIVAAAISALWTFLVPMFYTGGVGDNAATT